MAKGGARTATGSFDYDILKSLTSIQGNIKELLKLQSAMAKKPYEEARDNLVKLKKEKKDKKEKFKLPKLPSQKSIVDGFLNLGKIVLAGAFLAGLLKDKIVEVFNAWKPATLLGKAFKDLFTKGDGEMDFTDRIKTALSGFAFWATVGAAAGVGFLVGGPVGMLAGAMVGAGLAAFMSMLKTDTGLNAQKLHASMVSKFTMMGIYGVAGAIIGSFFGATIPGAIAGALLGLAISTIYEGLLKKKYTNKDVLGITGTMALAMANIFDYMTDAIISAGNYLIKQLNKIIPGKGIPLFKEDSDRMNKAQSQIRRAEMREINLRGGDDLINSGEDGKGVMLNASDAEIARVKDKTGFDLTAEAKHEDSVHKNTVVEGKGVLTESMKLESLWLNAVRHADLVQELEAATKFRDNNTKTVNKIKDLEALRDSIVVDKTEGKSIKEGMPGKVITVDQQKKIIQDQIDELKKIKKDEDLKALEIDERVKFNEKRDNANKQKSSSENLETIEDLKANIKISQQKVKDAKIEGVETKALSQLDMVVAQFLKEEQLKKGSNGSGDTNIINDNSVVTAGSEKTDSPVFNDVSGLTGLSRANGLTLRSTGQ
jgi:hypothetical protein